MRGHLVLIPFPAQGHLTSLLNLAKLLHSKGFYVTFVLTEFTHRRLLRSRGPHSVAGLPDFRFETVPDGLPPSDADATQDIPSLCSAVMSYFHAPFSDLIKRLLGRSDDQDRVPRVTGIVSDGSMIFTLDVAEELKIPVVLFHTISACGLLGYLSFPELARRGYTPLKDESFLTNGYLDTTIDWIPGMGDIRLGDLPSFLRTTDPDDVMLRIMMKRADCARRADAIILNTFDDLDRDLLAGIRDFAPNVYTIGPLTPVCRQIAPDPTVATIGSNLLKEDSRCLDWLDTQADESVIYVNYGSITVMTPQQLEEFAWGLVDSGHPFLWVIRPDLLAGTLANSDGDAAKLGRDLVKEMESKKMSMLVAWCNQEAVLAHRSIGGFLTHCGWNSTLESITEGVPMICWPFFAEQPTNRRYVCRHWGIGMDMDGEVRRERVAELVREMMGRERGREMRRRALEWKEKAKRAIADGGSSMINIERLVRDLTLANSL